MTIILLIISLGIAGFGAYLIGDFFLWLIKGRVVTATIKGVQGKKDKGLALPIVLFEDKDDKEHEVPVARIDQFLFLLNRPKDNEFTTVIYQEDDPQRARIYGYINVLTGVFAMVPLFFTLALKVDTGAALAQVSYAVIFGVLIMGGWIFLKTIQRYY